MQRKARAGAAQVPDHGGVVHEARVEPAAYKTFNPQPGKDVNAFNSSLTSTFLEGACPGEGWGCEVEGFIELLL